MSPSPLDVVGLLRELLRETRKSGIPTSHEIAVSEDFFEGPYERRLHEAGRAFRAKFVEAKMALARDLGPAEDRDRDVENLMAVWSPDGTEVRLVLAHEDKELPFVLTLHAEHGGAPLGAGAGEVPACACSTLKTTKNPFTGGRAVLMSNNPAIQKTHLRVAATKVGSTTVRLVQCQGCGQLRQSGDAGVPYVFEVPPIDVEEWEREPYVDKVALEMYEAAYRRYLETADRTTTGAECRTAGCSAKAVRFSVFCFDHHKEDRPVPPPGRRLE